MSAIEGPFGFAVADDEAAGVRHFFSFLFSSLLDLLSCLYYSSQCVVGAEKEAKKERKKERAVVELALRTCSDFGERGRSRAGMASLTSAYQVQCLQGYVFYAWVAE